MKKIGIIGTETTVNSGMYVKLIQELEPQAQVIGKAFYYLHIPPPYLTSSEL